MDERFKDLVSKQHGFAWVDDRKPEQKVRMHRFAVRFGWLALRLPDLNLITECSLRKATLRLV